MDKDNRKKLIHAYKERSQTQEGCIYTITNTVNNKVLVGTAADLSAIQNRFESAIQFGGSFHPKMSADWSVHGSNAFEFQIVETLSKTAAQSPQEFLADLELLKKIWLDKTDQSLLY